MTPADPSGADVRLRPLALDDVDRVMELEDALFGPGAWSRGAYVEELTSAYGRTYVAAVVDDDGRERVVGYGGLAAGDEAQVLTVGVEAAYRRRGIGALLVDALLSAARTGGARTALLEVRASDDVAQRLYARAGFVPIGVRRGYYQAEGEDAVVMRARLTRTPGPVGSEHTGGGAPPAGSGS
ncbi:ribosomal protein S18-alanine N-acetyltransferase [Georgenia halophila]|uniref:Ribosomal protein S18-alanine N-acetyltransferase n=1 Tax=Georgenia halophila TaxID=620889 RepID=A0ABP8KWE1_9MICO